MRVFSQAGRTNYYAVNAGERDSYVLAAGAVRGPGSTVYVMKLATNGAFAQATWHANTSLYPPVPSEAAEWVARRRLGYTDEPLVDAQLRFDPSVDASPFFPHWELEFDVDGSPVVAVVEQNVDLGGDTDGDGMSDRSELYAGVNPEDASVQLGVMGTRESISGDSIAIRWPSVGGRFYSIYRGADLTDDLTILQSHIAATPPENTYTDQLSEVTMFYRIEVE